MSFLKDAYEKNDPQAFKVDFLQRVLVFYAVCESLFNIVKRSGILKATVNFEHRDHDLRLAVSDEGKGFDRESVMRNSKAAHGLLIIRHKLRLLGCNMNVESQPRKGTAVIIEVPYEKMDS